LNETLTGAIWVVFASENSMGGGTINPPQFDPHSWHHYALTLNRNTMQMCEYIDGENWYVSYWLNAFEGDLSTNSFSLGIGATPNDIDSSYYFIGEIDEVRIWNIVRTKTQIQTFMSDTLGPGFYETPNSGLIAYYRFDESENLGVGGDGLPDDIRDLSINGNHGDLNGGPILVLSHAFTDIEIYNTDIPHHYYLSQNYPNPFNPVTHIRFGLPKASDVKIELYNTLGQRVTTLLDEKKPAGYHVVNFDASKIASGVYFYQMDAVDFQKVRKMLVLK
jgi:hypothetical protein